MRCACPACGILMPQGQLRCVCPECGHTCEACMGGTSGVLSPEQIKALAEAGKFDNRGDDEETP